MKQGESRRFILGAEYRACGGKGAETRPFLDWIDRTLAEERVITGDKGEEGGDALARHLIAFEAEFAARQPAKVVLGDSSEAALAAALVAAKMEIALEATAAATDAATLNGRLIAQLVPTYTEVA